MRLLQQVISHEPWVRSQTCPHRTHADRSTLGFSAEGDSGLGARWDTGSTSGFCSCSCLGSALGLGSGSVAREVPIIRDWSSGVRTSRDCSELDATSFPDLDPEERPVEC